MEEYDPLWQLVEVAAEKGQTRHYEDCERRPCTMWKRYLPNLLSKINISTVFQPGASSLEEDKIVLLSQHAFNTQPQRS